jgi:hypothetical protein
MRILCDHNVDEKYIDTFRDTEWITVTTVRDELTQEAKDPAISEYAAQNEWIVFTEDEDFHELPHVRGVIYYNHIESPSPGDVVEAMQNITEGYDDYRYINEYVPNGWIDDYYK